MLVVSKVFEKIMHDQISQYINSFLTPYLCGYRKGFSTQQALLSIIEKWKIVLDSKSYGGAYSWISQKLLTLLIMIF